MKDPELSTRWSDVVRSGHIGQIILLSFGVWLHAADELMVSTVTLQRLIGMSSKTFANRKCIRRFDEIAMTAPVFGGDTLYADSEIIDVDADAGTDTGTLRVCCRGTNQDDQEVTSKSVGQDFSFLPLPWKTF